MMGYEGLTLAVELMLTLIYTGRLEAFRVSLPDGALAGVKILDVSSTPVLYRHDGDSVQELLDICPEKVKNPGDGGCTAECPLVSPELTATGPVCSTEDKKILKRLKDAQEVVAAFKNNVEFSATETSINFMILLVTVSMGIFLFYRKHFLYKTMCDSRLADPTSGMPLWQFRRMKFTPTTVADTRPHEERVRERWENMSKTQMEKDALAKLEVNRKKSSMIQSSPNYYGPSDDDDGSIPVPAPRAQGQSQGQGQGQGQGFELNPTDIDYAQEEAEAMAANEKKPKKAKGKIRRFFSNMFSKGKKEDGGGGGLADDEAEDEDDDEDDEEDGGHRRHHFRHRDPRHLHPTYETGRKTAPVKLSSSRRHSSTGSSARAPPSPSPPPPTTPTVAPTVKKDHGRDKKVTIVVPEPEHPV